MTQPNATIAPLWLAELPKVTFSLGDYGPDEEDLQWKRQQDRMEGDRERNERGRSHCPDLRRRGGLRPNTVARSSRDELEFPQHELRDFNADDIPAITFNLGLPDFESGVRDGQDTRSGPDFESSEIPVPMGAKVSEDDRPTRWKFLVMGYVACAVVAYFVIPHFSKEEAGVFRRILSAALMPLSLLAFLSAIVGWPWWLFQVGKQMAEEAGRTGLFWRVIYFLLAAVGLALMCIVGNLLYALFLEGVWIFD